MAIEFMSKCSDLGALVGRIVMTRNGCNAIEFRGPFRVTKVAARKIEGLSVPVVFGDIDFAKTARGGRGGYYRADDARPEAGSPVTMSGIRSLVCVCDTLDEVVEILNLGFDYETAENALRREFEAKARGLSGRNDAR